MSFFDSEKLENPEIKESVIPFHLRKVTGEAQTLEWLNEEFDLNLRVSERRIQTYYEYNRFYSGNYYGRRLNRNTSGDLDGGRSEGPRKSYNYIHEMVETRVSQAARRTASLTVIPRHGNESQDRNSARAAEILLESKRRELKIDAVHSEADRAQLILGNSFVFVTWDKTKGPIREKKEKDDENIRIGEVCIENVWANHVFPEIRKKKFSDLNWITKVVWTNIEEIKAMYPSKAESIEPYKKGETKKSSETTRSPGEGEHYWDLSLSEPPTDQIPVKYFYHKAVNGLPKGKFIKWVAGAILEESDLEEVANDTGELPCRMDSDLDMLDDFWGRSHIVNTYNLQTLANALLNSVTDDFGNNSIGRWFVQKGSGTKSSELTNKNRVVTYTGQNPPIYAAPSPTNPEAIPFFELLGRLIGKQSSVYEITRGEVPKGVTANSALRFLDEQESNRTETSDKKKAERQRDVAMLLLATIRTHYKDDDGRMVRTIGKGRQHLNMAVKRKDFERVNSIDIQNTSALPKTKSGKIAAITDLNISTQTDPVFRRKEVIDQLDLGNEEYFVTGATVAVTTARFMLDQILEGKEVPQITPADDLLVHYSVLDKEIQSVSYKISEQITKDMRKIIEDRMKTIERLLYQQAEKSPKMLQELLMLEGFPKFFEPTVSLWELQMQLASIGGAPAGGEQVNSQKYRDLKLKEQEDAA